MLVFSRTDQGKLRPSNQDALVLMDGLYGVADGMGGHKGGEVASAEARDGLEHILRGKEPSPSMLKMAVEAVNRRLYFRQTEDEALSGMGTTLTVLWAARHAVYIAQVGDSRGYLLRDGTLAQITKDHSVVQELVDQGVLTLEQAAHSTIRNIITRALGSEKSLEVDIFTRARKKGDLWLLCTDGLSGMVEDKEIARVLRENAPEEAAEKLLQLALENGGRDNVSFVLLLDEEGGE